MRRCVDVKEKSRIIKQKQKNPKILLQLRFSDFYFNSPDHKEEQKEAASEFVLDFPAFIISLIKHLVQQLIGGFLLIPLDNFLGCPLTLMHIFKWSLSKCKRM